MSEAILKKTLSRLGALTAAIVKEDCNGPDDAIAVAVALMMSAQTIFRELGGNHLAAAQFYMMADSNVGAPAAEPFK